MDEKLREKIFKLIDKAGDVTKNFLDFVLTFSEVKNEIEQQNLKKEEKEQGENK